MQSINKKALSETISTILLIALGISLAVLLAIAYEKTIPDHKRFSPGFSCDDLIKEEPLFISDACYNALTRDFEVTIERDYSDIEINSLEFVFLSQDNEESSWVCSNSCGNCKVLEQGELKKYYFAQENPNIQEELAIKTGSCYLKRSSIREC